MRHRVRAFLVMVVTFSRRLGGRREVVRAVAETYMSGAGGLFGVTQSLSDKSP